MLGVLTLSRAVIDAAVRLRRIAPEPYGRVLTMGPDQPLAAANRACAAFTSSR
jgi:hypothetical protein